MTWTSDEWAAVKEILDICRGLRVPIAPPPPQPEPREAIAGLALIGARYNPGNAAQPVAPVTVVVGVAARGGAVVSSLAVVWDDGLVVQGEQHGDRWEAARTLGVPGTYRPTATYVVDGETRTVELQPTTVVVPFDATPTYSASSASAFAPVPAAVVAVADAESQTAAWLDLHFPGWRADADQVGSRTVDGHTPPDSGVIGDGNPAVIHGYDYPGAPKGPANPDGTIDVPPHGARVWVPWVGYSLPKGAPLPPKPEGWKG